MSNEQLNIFRERYRDLILAADTIRNMKITSERVIARIISIEDKFRELQKKYLIGFKIEPVKNENNRYLQLFLLINIYQLLFELFFKVCHYLAES